MFTSKIFVPITGTLYVSKQSRLIPHPAVVYSRLLHFFKCYHVCVSSKDSRYRPKLFSQAKSIVSVCSAVNDHNHYHKNKYNLPILKTNFFNLNLKAYYSEKRFTFENPGFASYIKSLEEEFTSLQSSLNETKDKKNIGSTDSVHDRLAFLNPVIENVQVLNQKHSELQELMDLHKSKNLLFFSLLLLLFFL